MMQICVVDSFQATLMVNIEKSSEESLEAIKNLISLSRNPTFYWSLDQPMTLNNPNPQ